jgi:hypothetical protein
MQQQIHVLPIEVLDEEILIDHIIGPQEFNLPADINDQAAPLQQQYHEDLIYHRNMERDGHYMARWFNNSFFCDDNELWPREWNHRTITFAHRKSNFSLNI